MSLERLSNIAVILVAFLATLGCYTALQIVGVEGSGPLQNILLTLAGVLGGVAVGKIPSRAVEPEPTPEP